MKKKDYGYEMYEMIVVVNGSTDSTERIVGGICKIGENVRSNRGEAGYGFVLRKGLKSAKGK